jgi:hypothetical protein
MILSYSIDCLLNYISDNFKTLCIVVHTSELNCLLLLAQKNSFWVSILLFLPSVLGTEHLHSLGIYRLNLDIVSSMYFAGVCRLSMLTWTRVEHIMLTVPDFQSLDWSSTICTLICNTWSCLPEMAWLYSCWC